jgi:hypothetical protein
MAPEILTPFPGLPAQQGPETRDAAFRPSHARPGRPQVWLPVAAGGLGVLAGAAATVSYAAQYRLVDAARHLTLAAALEAAIPDAAALVFACLGVALALLGRRAMRARLLNIASAGASVLMNVIAAAPGWRNLAVWAMPPAAYALASDTLIGVVRTSAVARRQHTDATPEVSFLAVLGGLALWLLRLSVAPRSTAAGFRAWVVEECPVAPGRRVASPAVQPADADNLENHTDRTDAGRTPSPARVSRPHSQSGGTRSNGTKTARFLALIAEEHGPLADIPLSSVARICSTSAPRIGLHTGSARTALRRAVLSAQQSEPAEQNATEGDQ